MSQAVKSSNFVSWIIFLTTLTVAIISVISVIFPAVILSNSQTSLDLENVGITHVGPNAFEIGVWTGPLIAANLIVFVTYFLHIKKRLPNTLSNILKRIFKFEISKKVSFIVIGILLSIYIIGSIGELSSEED